MTANTPLPIPSKAAIRALRGLVLGTSCTLALIAEDRRRRINAARSALRNGDRIRSARRYHAGGSAFAIALEEESLTVEPGVIHWTEKPEVSRSRDSRPALPQAAPTSSSPELLDWSNAVPSVSRRHSYGPDKQSTSWRTNRLLRNDSPVALTASSVSLLTASPPAPLSPPTATSSTSHAAATTIPRPTQSHQPDTQPPAFPFPSSQSSLPRHIQKPAPSLARQAQAYRDWTGPSALAGNRTETESHAGHATAAEAAARILEMTTTHHLAAAVQTLASTAPVASSPMLWVASAALCRACQEAGRMDLAQDVLQLAVRCGQLNEATYFAHNPLPVVRSMAPLDDLQKQAATPSLTPVEAAARRRASVRRLQDAATLFLPPSTVQSSPQQMHAAAADLAGTARTLLECAFSVPSHKLRLTRSVYAAVAAYPGDLSALTHWYLGQLRHNRDYETLLWAFLAQPPTPGALSDAAFFEIGDCVVEAIRLSPSPQTAAASTASVLQGLLALCSSSSDGRQRRLRTTWVADLLYTQWQRTLDFQQIQQLFAQLAGGDQHGSRSRSRSQVSMRVYHANGAYRVMVQIALEAGRASDAQLYFDELVAQEPAAEGDIRLLGLFALAKAKQGDWQGVRADFSTAAVLAGGRRGGGRDHNRVDDSTEPPRPTSVPILRGADRVFVPIVKEHIRTHTISETETFLKMYIDELGVPVGRDLVTLLGNEYGALGEVQSFVSWLTYCAGAGFVVDAAFSNTILHSCRKHWKFGFRDLCTMHRQLCALSPCFEDNVTQTILAHAALADANKHHHHQPHYVSRPRPLASPASSSTASRPAPRDEHDFYLAMKQAFAAGCPSKTVRLYKHAVRDSRLVPGGKCLKLAVAATLRCGDKSSSSSKSHHPPLPTAARFDEAIDMLRTARAAGQDIDAATAYIALAYIDALCPRAALSGSSSRRHSGSGAAASRHKAVKVAETANDVLGRLAACGVQMSDLALNRAAFHLFKAGHMRGAIALALSAVDAAENTKPEARKHGHPRRQPGYNVWNFAVLVSAYARLADADGIRRVAAGAAASGTGVTGELLGYKVLKQARRQLRQRCEEEAERASAGSGADAGADPHHDEETVQALQAVEEALEQARAARQRLGTERQQLETAAMAIMRRAARAAVDESVGSSSTEDSRMSSSISSTSSISSISSTSSTSSIDSLGVLEEQAPLSMEEQELDHVVRKTPVAASAA